MTFEFNHPTSGTIGSLTFFGDNGYREKVAISVSGTGAMIADTSGEGTTSGSTLSYDTATLGGATSVGNLLSYTDVTTFKITYTCLTSLTECGSLFNDWVVDEVRLTSNAPLDNSSDVAISDNIALTFNEDIAAGTGNIVISDGATDIRTIPVGDAQITILNSTLTINPTANLTASTSYFVQVDAAAVDDLVGNSFAGVADTTTFNFTTAAASDTAAPTFDIAATVDSVTSTGFTPSASIDEAGVIYYVVVADGASAPSPAQIKAGNDATDSPALASSSSSVASAPFTSSFSAITSLSASTAYDVYFVAADDEATPNLQPSVAKVDTTTAAANSPALEFARHKEEIRRVIVSDAQRNLRSTLGSARNLTSNARQRFSALGQTGKDCSDVPSGNARQRNSSECDAGNIPFDVDGTAQYSRGVLSSAGNFLEVRETEDGNQRRLFFGDFGIQRDADASVTATLNAKMAWEQIVSDQTLYGYFIGGQLAQSNIEGSLTGDNQRIGVEAGAYAVHQLGQTLYLDGFASVGFSNNTLELADDVLTLNGDYLTRTFAFGATLSGVVDRNSYELRPELAFNFGKAWIGDVGFTGTAYGMTDDTLSLDAGSVTLASLTFRPEFFIPLDGRDPADSNTQLSFSPRLICEHVKTTTSTEYCGAGAEFGFSSASENGESTADIKLIMDRIDNGTRSSVQFGIEHRF